MSMNKEEETKLLKEAVRMWGTRAQMTMLIEECAELIKTVCKLDRASKDPHEAALEFVDELVDVSVMVDQFILEVGQERFDRARDLKMKRLKEKLFVYSEAHRTKPEMPWPQRINLTEFM